MTLQDGTIRLAAMGDVMLARDVGRHFRNKPEDFTLDGIRNILNNYDIVILNLENPVGTKGVPHPIQDPNVTFCCHPEALQVLRNLNTTIVSLGNNHMLDYGEAALCETLEHLDAQGILYVGAGRNYEEANRPLLVDKKDKKLAFLSHVFIYSASTRMATKDNPGVAEYRMKKILPKIRQLNLQGYQVIVSVHWGHEYSFYPIPYQMEQARAMIDMGALLIIGHGPHYPQGIEDYRGGKIIYSLGNFIFDEPHKYANRSFIYGVEIDSGNKLKNEKTYPVQIENHIPFVLNGGNKKSLNNLIHNLSHIYKGKSNVFWKDVSNKYFNDIVRRVSSMKSFKFICLPPLSFYVSVGFKNYIHKIKIKNILSLIR